MVQSLRSRGSFLVGELLEYRLIGRQRQTEDMAGFVLPVYSGSMLTPGASMG